MEIEIVSGKQPKPIRLGLYGTDGSGKSTFFKDGLFLDLEGGLGEIDTESINLVNAKLEDVIDALKYVYQYHKKIKRKMIVVDSLDWLEKMIFQSVCDAKGVESIEDIGYGKGYTFALSHWKNFLQGLDALRELGFTIGLIAHSEIVRVEDPRLDPYDRHDLKLHKKVRGLIREWCDVVAFVSPEIFTSKSGDKFGVAKFTPTATGRRIMHLSEQPTFEAKSRLSLPDTLPLEWNAFQSAVESARGENVTNNNE